MKAVVRIALVVVAIVDLTAAEALGQAMPVPALLAEFGLPGQWAAPSCDRPYVVLAFESGPTSQFVIRRDKDGARFDITSAKKLQNDLAELELRPASFFKDSRWQAASAADANQVLQYAFGKRDNKFVSLWEMQLRLGVPAGVYTKCTTLGPFDSAPRGTPPPPPPPPPPPRR
jgi:hypothetical protein